MSVLSDLVSAGSTGHCKAAKQPWQSPGWRCAVRPCRRGGAVRRPFFCVLPPCGMPLIRQPFGLPPSPQGEGFGAAIVLPVIARLNSPVIARPVRAVAIPRLEVRSPSTPIPSPGGEGGTGVGYVPDCPLSIDTVFSPGGFLFLPENIPQGCMYSLFYKFSICNLHKSFSETGLAIYNSNGYLPLFNEY